MDPNVIYGVFLCRAGIQGDFGLLYVRRRCVQYVFLTVSGEENDWETALFSCQFFSCLFCHLEFPQNDLLRTDPVDTSVLKHLPSWFSWINKAQMSRIKTADLNAFCLWSAETFFFSWYTPSNRWYHISYHEQLLTVMLQWVWARTCLRSPCVLNPKTQDPT